MYWRRVVLEQCITNETRVASSIKGKDWRKAFINRFFEGFKSVNAMVGDDLVPKYPQRNYA